MSVRSSRDENPIDWKSVFVKVDKASPEYEWLKHQDNVNKSVRLLIKLATEQFGNTDLVDAFVSKLVESDVVVLPTQPFPHKVKR